ncbi:MAG: hypothetical protein RL481_993, partial [Pseudomonadota bacterium]
RERLGDIAKQIDSSDVATTVSVRDFLWWWGAERRSYWTVLRIRRDLAEAGLETIPDFQSTYLDAQIAFGRAIDQINDDSEEIELVEELDAPLTIEDPTYRISKLAAANQTIVSVSPDATLEEVVTVMMERDFSQVPVMVGERDVKGIVTWQSIGSRLALKGSRGPARAYMEKARIVSSSDSIFEVIDQVVQFDHVLVRKTDNVISGIITASDLSIQFRALSEAFLILSEIENLVRMLIEPKFSVEELVACKDPSDAGRIVEGVADLSFGEYIKLLENEGRWKKFSIPVDRKKFCAGLDGVREIRNDVMHFDPDGIPSDDIEKLREFAKFLRKLRSIMQ